MNDYCTTVWLISEKLESALFGKAGIIRSIHDFISISVVETAISLLHTIEIFGLKLDEKLKFLSHPSIHVC